MALMDAKPFDEAGAKRRRNSIWAAVAIVILCIAALWHLRFWPEEHAVNKFFKLIEAQNYENAYALWMADPDWKQHPDKYSRYPFNEFVQDWGPSSEYGAIHSHKIVAAGDPPTGRGSGVIVEAEINGRPATAKLWVEKSDKSLGFPP